MVTTNQKPKIAIAGAGIAGLTAALALAQSGFEVAVFEKNDVLQPVGTGIQLSPNAFTVLKGLGLGESLLEQGFTPSGVDIRSGLTGSKLSFFELGSTMVSRHGAPYLMLHRADLASILKTACDAQDQITFHFEHILETVEQTSWDIRFVTCHRSNNTSHSADVLIGADGVWSRARQFIDDAAQPAFAGRIAWRAVLEMDRVPDTLTRDATGLWLGPHAHLVHYPLQDGSRMNVIAISPWQNSEPPRQGWIDEAQTDKRLAAFAEWIKPLRDLVAAQADWGGWPINAVSRADAWSDRRLAIIGDAAHAMVPFAAQGGAAAIEDAGMLAKLCAFHPENLPDAFRLLATSRTKRVNRIIALSNGNRRAYHMSGPLAQARNLALKMAPQEALQRRMDWLYGWNV